MADIFPTDYISYLDGRRSKFPNEIDQIPEKFNLPAHLKDSLKRFQELFLKETLTPQEQIEFNELQNTLQPFLDDPETRNYLGDILVNMQKFFKEDVEPYVDNMKQDVLNYTNNKKQEIEQYTENKKQEFQVEVDKFTFRGEWQPNTQYYQKNIVIYGGEAYIAKTNNINIVPTNTNYWAKIAAKGEKGDPSLNINYKGEYNNNTIYVEGDAVTFGGLWYYAKKTTQGNPPTNEEYWELHSNQAIISNTQPFDSRITLWIDTSRNVVRFYNSATGKWEVAGSDRIVNNDGSASYAYDDIKEIENNVNNLKEQFDKAQYTPEIYNSARVFSMGQGYDKEGNAVDYSGSVVNGQISCIIKGLTVTNIVRNGDFRDGLTGWRASVGSPTLTVENGILTIQTGEAAGAVSEPLYGVKSGDVLFISFYNASDNDGARIRIWPVSSSDVLAETPPTDMSEDLKHYSFLVTVGEGVDTGIRLYLRNNGTSVTRWSKIMVINLTAMGLEDLTIEQAKAMFTHYIEGTKSTFGAIRLKSVGKNIWGSKKAADDVVQIINNSNYAYLTNIDGRNCLALVGHDSIRNKDIFNKFKPNTQYTIQVYAKRGYSSYNGGYLQINYTDGSVASISPPSDVWSKVVYTSVSGKTIKSIRLNYSYFGHTTYFDYNTLQLEEGTQATEYEPYKESTLYVTAKDEEGNILELRSLPNGTKDEIRVSGGKAELVKRVNEVVLDGSEDWMMANPASANPDNIRVYTTISDALNGSVCRTNRFIDNVNTVYYEGASFAAANKNFHISIALDKLQVPNIDGVKQWLRDNPVTLNYQLAEPIEIPIEVFGNLQSYENGTVYVDTIIPRIDFYDINGIAVDVPIGNIDTLYKVDKETGYLYSLDISQAEISQDRLSFIHPDLVEGDLVDWDYVPDVESTNPAISMKLPTNLKASVTSALQGVQELSNKTKKLDTRVIANRRDIEKLDTRVTTNRRDIDWNNFILGILENKFNTHLSENSGKHITESGENPHGSYIKFDDGTMICRGETTVTTKINTQWGSLYYYTIGRLTFPHAFVEIPHLIPVNLGNRSVILDTYGVRQTDTGNISIYRPVADDQEYDYSVGYVAIGRWK